MLNTMALSVRTDAVDTERTEGCENYAIATKFISKDTVKMSEITVQFVCQLTKLQTTQRT